jgi:hypothetical protein
MISGKCSTGNLVLRVQSTSITISFRELLALAKSHIPMCVPVLLCMQGPRACAEPRARQVGTQVSLDIFLSLSLDLFICVVSLSVSVFVWLWVSASVSVCLSVCLSMFLCRCRCTCLYLCLCLSVCLSVFVGLLLARSQPQYHLGISSYFFSVSPWTCVTYPSNLSMILSNKTNKRLRLQKQTQFRILASFLSVQCSNPMIYPTLSFSEHPLPLLALSIIA